MLYIYYITRTQDTQNLSLLCMYLASVSIDTLTAIEKRSTLCITHISSCHHTWAGPVFTQRRNARRCVVVMLEYIDNIEVSFRYRYVESYPIRRLSIDFFRYIIAPKFCS